MFTSQAEFTEAVLHHLEAMKPGTWDLRENVVDEDERDREGIPVPLDRTHHVVPILTLNGLLWWLSGEESACNAGDLSSVSGPGRSLGEANGNPFQVSCL